MFGLTKLVLLYLLVLGSGVRIVSRLPLVGRLDWWLMTLAFGASQLLLSIQLLSLFQQLTGYAMLWLNAALTGGVFLATRSWPAAPLVRAPAPGVQMSVFARAHPLESLMVTLAVVSVIASAVTGGLIYPFTDIYHYTMPLFWKQHASILPFQAYDPRLIGVVFGSEGLCFPSFLFIQSGTACAWMAGLAGLMSIWIVIAVAQQLGASKPAAVCAGALLAGLGPVSVSLFGAMADMLLPGMWFGGSVYFLLASRDRENGEIQLLPLGCSILCLTLACGTKNIALLQVPSWLTVATFWHGRRLFGRKALGIMTAWGLSSLVVSGVAWSYASNLKWFGTIKGGRELQGTVSTEMHPRAIWTRIARGTVMMAFDVIWVPQRFSETYANVCARAVQVFGGLERLDEDRDFFSFTEDGPRPGRGLGPLGIAFFLPGLVVGLARSFRRKNASAEVDRRFPPAGALAILTLGSFLTCYVVLRWQSIGINRMMLSCVMAGMPLTALLLEKRWAKLLALVLLTISLGMYGVSGSGQAVRRLDLAGRSWMAARIASLQRNHFLQVEYRWRDEAASSLRVREDYTRRELYQLLFSRLREPAVVGLIGSFNAEGFYAFGPKYSNRVVSLVDSRVPNQQMKPPPQVEFIIAELQEIEGLDAEVLRDFDLWLEVTKAGKPVFAVFKRREMTPR